MDGIALSTAGITLGYAIETVAGTRPTTGYIIIPDLQSVPDFDPAPNNIDVTTLAETEYMQYIPGLKDPGGAMSFGFRNTELLQTEWRTLVDDAETGRLAGFETWFEVKVPELSNSFWFSGEPSNLGLAAASVNSALTINGNITASKIVGWGAKST